MAAVADNQRSCAPEGKRSRHDRRRHLRHFLIIQDGATGIEYALIAFSIALAIVIGASWAGNGLNRMFIVIGTQLEVASNPTGATAGN